MKLEKEKELKLNKRFIEFLDEIGWYPEEIKQIECEVDLGNVVKNNNEFLDEPNHTVDVSKESENNLNDMIEYKTRTIGKTKPQEDEDGCCDNKSNTSWIYGWDEEEPIFVRTIDVRLKNGETYIYEFDNTGELCLCELEDDTTLIFEYIKTLGKGNEWIELRNIGFEYSLVRVLDIVEVKVRYEEV